MSNTSPFEAPQPPPPPPPNPPHQPSQLYKANTWQAGLRLAHALPTWLLRALCQIGAFGYSLINHSRRKVVVQNLLPIFDGDRSRANRAALRLFREFGIKLADLWRFESGRPLAPLDIDSSAWEQIQSAHAKGRGILMVCPHLGNWELGGPLLADHGMRLLVITQAEPGGGFTELRRESRARWGIETLVIREDAFAFLEVIKRLQSGAVVALLLDRPPPPTAVPVELFGRPFLASSGPAELARATGCAMFGVCIVRAGSRYRVHLLPEFTYDRALLGNRESRREFTAQMMRAFEPYLRKYPDQWYHFVPVWPDQTPTL